MNPQAQQQSQTLDNIRNQLIKIRDSDALQNVEPDSEVAQGLAGVFGAAGNVFSDLQVENGVLTSRSAQQAVSNADRNIRTQRGVSSGGDDPFAALQEQNRRLQQSFDRERETREALEADMSIADQRAKRTADEAAAKAAAGTQQRDASATTPSATGEQVAAGVEQDAFSGIESDDPIVQAQIQNAREQRQLINQQIDALDKFVDASEEDTKALVESLRNTAERQIGRAERENARLAQAARVSGIVSGRGMYSPEEHEGIISEVIQEGLDRIGEIENTKNTAIMEAKKAQREFRYEAFVQMSDMVSALSDMKRQTIVDVNTRLNEIEQQERDKMKFDQEQADRNAFILAPELQNATSEEIARVAEANGIDVGLLAREVQQYKDQQTMTQLDISTKEAQLTGQRLQNAVRQENLNDLRAKVSEDPEKTLTVDEVKKWSDELGLRDNEGNSIIPPSWTRTDLNEFVEAYGNAPLDELPRLVRVFQGLTQLEPGDDIPSDLIMSEEEATQKAVTNIKDSLFKGQRIVGKGSTAAQLADGADVSSFWTAGKFDARRWWNSPQGEKQIKEEAEQLAELGWEWYEIRDEIVQRYEMMAQ